jgi:hypothetical protein
LQDERQRKKHDGERRGWVQDSGQRQAVRRLAWSLLSAKDRELARWRLSVSKEEPRKWGACLEVAFARQPRVKTDMFRGYWVVQREREEILSECLRDD